MGNHICSGSDKHQDVGGLTAEICEPKSQHTSTVRLFIGYFIFNSLNKARAISFDRIIIRLSTVAINYVLIGGYFRIHFYLVNVSGTT